MRRRLGHAGERLGEAKHPGPAHAKVARVLTDADIEERARKQRRKLWRDDLLQRGGFVPQDLGHGVWNLRGEELRFADYAPAAVASGVVPGRGGRLVHLRDHGAQVTVSAAGLTVYVGTEDTGAAAAEAALQALGDDWATDKGPAVSALSYLRDAKRRGAYVPPGQRLGPFLALTEFVGDLDHPPARQLPALAPPSALGAELAAATSVLYTGARRDFALRGELHFGGRSQWRATTAPDAVVSPAQAAGEPAERALGSAVVLVYVVSAQQGSTVDAPAAALEAVFAGVLACLAREARRREWAASGAAAPAGLERPVLVACLPSGWQTCVRGQPAKPAARVWRSEWVDAVRVRVSRSRAMHTVEALDHVFTAVS